MDLRPSDKQCKHKYQYSLLLSDVRPRIIANYAKSLAGQAKADRKTGQGVTCLLQIPVLASSQKTFARPLEIGFDTGQP
jgi:hypothetical protein